MNNIILAKKNMNKVIYWRWPSDPDLYVTLGVFVGAASTTATVATWRFGISTLLIIFGIYTIDFFLFILSLEVKSIFQYPLVYFFQN